MFILRFKLSAASEVSFNSGCTMLLTFHGHLLFLSIECNLRTLSALFSSLFTLFFCLSVVTYDMQCRVMKHIHTRMNSLKATVQSTQNTHAHTINYISVSHHHMHNISSHRSLYYINKLILSPLEHVLFDIEKIQQFDALYASVCSRVRLHVWYNVHCTFCRLIRLFWDVS